jgi:hypothetical protein
MANNPQFPVNLVKETWTKIATGVLTGTIYNRKTTVGYFQTFRVTGDPAPTDLNEGVSMFLEHPDYEPIGSDSPIDVWVFCRGKDGILRVDL